MKRNSLAVAAGAIGAAILNSVAAPVDFAARGVHRVAAGTKRARQMTSVKTPHNRSKYMPHIGAKEQERAKRFEMVHSHANFPYGRRSSPVMNRISARDFAEMQKAA